METGNAAHPTSPLNNPGYNALSNRGHAQHIEAVVQPDSKADQWVFGFSDDSFYEGLNLRLKADGSIEADFMYYEGAVKTSKLVTVPGAYVGDGAQKLHLAMVRLGIHIALYVNGVPMVDVLPSASKALVTDLPTFAVASSPYPWDDKFDGVIDEVAFFDTVHSSVGPRIVARYNVSEGGHDISNMILMPSGYLRIAENAVGYYEPPDAHQVHLSSTGRMRMNVAWDVVAITAEDLQLEPDMQSVGQVEQSDAGSRISVTTELGLSNVAFPNSESDWDEWSSFRYGYIVARHVRMRLKIQTAPGIKAELRALQWSADVPDRTDLKTTTTRSDGPIHRSFVPPMNAPVEDIAVMVTLIDSALHPVQPGDTIKITNKTQEGYDVEVINAGGRVARFVQLYARGY